MKEIHYFFVPEAELSDELPDEEARHAAKVLRLHSGDNIVLIDGKGTFYKAVVADISPRSCRYDILEAEKQKPAWNGRIHLAVAPTKNMDRTEWLVEKAAEIGFDELSFVCSRFSERRTLKLDRIERILVSAVKQSHKAFLPKVNDMISFDEFIRKGNLAGARYIAHCLNENVDYSALRPDVVSPNPDVRHYLPAVMENGDMTVLIGPEGDFAIDEVNAAMSERFIPVSLGNSRLRTETAALYAVMLMNLRNSLREDEHTPVDVFK